MQNGDGALDAEEVKEAMVKPPCLPAVVTAVLLTQSVPRAVPPYPFPLSLPIDIVVLVSAAVALPFPSN